MTASTRQRSPVDDFFRALSPRGTGVGYGFGVCTSPRERPPESPSTPLKTYSKLQQSPHAPPPFSPRTSATQKLENRCRDLEGLLSQEKQASARLRSDMAGVDKEIREKNKQLEALSNDLQDSEQKVLKLTSDNRRLRGLLQERNALLAQSRESIGPSANKMSIQSAARPIAIDTPPKPPRDAGAGAPPPTWDSLRGDDNPDNSGAPSVAKQLEEMLAKATAKSEAAEREALEMRQQARSYESEVMQRNGRISCLRRELMAEAEAQSSIRSEQNSEGAAQMSLQKRPSLEDHQKVKMALARAQDEIAELKSRPSHGSNSSDGGANLSWRPPTIADSEEQMRTSLATARLELEERTSALETLRNENVRLQKVIDTPQTAKTQQLEDTLTQLRRAMRTTKAELNNRTSKAASLQSEVDKLRACTNEDKKQLIAQLAEAAARMKDLEYENAVLKGN